MHPVVTPVRATRLDADHGSARSDLHPLIDLHSLTVDTLAGFETMVEKAEPAFRATAERFRALHAGQADRLARMIADAGGVVDADGSVMGAVNKAVITVRSWFDEIDDDVMDQVRKGEDHVLKAFDTAQSAPLPEGYQQALQTMRAELTDLLAATSHLD